LSFQLVAGQEEACPVEVGVCPF